MKKACIFNDSEHLLLFIQLPFRLKYNNKNYPQRANVFYRLELIEAYGTGIIKIMGAYEGTNMTPRIETSENIFKIILPNLNIAPIPKKQYK